MADTTPTEPTFELIQGLCLEAGRIMEDASVELAMGLPIEPDQIAERIENLGKAADAVIALAQAARALLHVASR